MAQLFPVWVTSIRTDTTVIISSNQVVAYFLVYPTAHVTQTTFKTLLQYFLKGLRKTTTYRSRDRRSSAEILTQDLPNTSRIRKRSSNIYIVMLGGIV
jgi:hypothetical protein